MSTPGRFMAVGLWLALMLCCLWLVVTSVRMTTDLEPFLLDDSATGQLLAQLGDGPAQRLILIGITGGTEQQRAAASRELAESLAASDQFARVMNGSAGLSAAERELLFSYRYLLSGDDAGRRFDQDTLAKALRARADELQSALALTDSREISTDPTQAMRSLLAQWQTDTAATQRHGVWFSADGKRALLTAETRAPALNLDAQAAAVAAIRTAFARHADQGLALELSGPPLFALESQETIRTEVTLLSIAASFAMMVILWLGYRSARVVLIAALPLGSAVLVAMATAGLLFGELYGITLGFGITLLGVAIDYPIHLFSHRRREETVKRTLIRIWPLLRLGVISTALGYLAMVTAGLPGLQQLGVFAIAGLLSAALVTRWLLPALLPADWAPTLVGYDHLGTQPRPGRHSVLLLAVAMGTLLAIVLVLQPPLWQDDPAALNPIPSQSLALDRKLRSAINAPEPGQLVVINAASAEAALRRSEALANKLEDLVQQGRIAGFDMAARYLPSRQTQRARQVALPTRPQLASNLNAVLDDLPYKRDAFAPFLQAVAESRDRPLLTPGDLAGTMLGARVESLLYESEDDWLALVTLAGVKDPAYLQRWFAEHAAGARYVDIKARTRSLMAETRRVALERVAWGAGLIGLILWLGLRNVKRTLAVILPVGLALLATWLVLLAGGGQLTLFHVVSLLLVLGVGVDYSLFFSHPGQDDTDARRTLHAIIICAASTVTVFGLLALSTIPVLRAIGLTVATGVAAAFIMGLLLARYQQPAGARDS